MDFSAIVHEPKSVLSYAYDSNTLHIRLKTARDDIKQVELLAIDPFNWIPRNDGSMVYDLDKNSVFRIRMEKEQQSRDYDCWFAQITDIEWKRIKYCFIVEDEREKYIIGCRDRIPYTEDETILYDLFNYYNYPYINEEDLYQAPGWIENTVWYQIFPDRFCNGSLEENKNVLPWGSDPIDGADKKFGGNLLGIIDKLDYIKEIGFNGIYLNPIFESPSSHKYDIADYFKIDSDFGDNDIFGQLVKEAHKRGIKVMLDAVFNHCGFLHPFWQDVLKYGKNSKYYDCFYVLDSRKPLVYGTVENGMPQDAPREYLNYRTFAFSQSMPKWKTGNPLVREYLIKVGCYWIENYNIDGWRLDVSNEVSHDFWREFRKAVKTVKPDVYILGENWDNSYPWLQGDQFDAVMNYGFQLPICNFFKNSNEEGIHYNTQDFQFTIGKLLTDYPRHVTKNLFNLLESHDTKRFLNVVDGNIKITKLAYILLFTYPGTPCMYYGSEIGMGGDEHSNRQCMVWEKEKQNIELLEFIRRLICLRKEHESFRTEKIEWMEQDINQKILFYKKETTKEILYVVINNEAYDIDIASDELNGVTVMDCISKKKERMTKEIKLNSNDFCIYLVGK
jgi:cyclomaltodextrinase / maltogenic alpha-amylase / neopullulanase